MITDATQAIREIASSIKNMKIHETARDVIIMIFAVVVAALATLAIGK